MLCSGIELDISHWTMNRKTAAWSNLMHAKISLRSSRPSEVIVFQRYRTGQKRLTSLLSPINIFFPPPKEANGRTRFLLHSPLFLAVMSPGVWKGNELNKNFGIEAATFAFFRLGSDDFLLLLSLAEKFKRYFNFLWLWQLWAESFLFFARWSEVVVGSRNWDASAKHENLLEGWRATGRLRGLLNYHFAYAATLHGGQ